MGGPYASRDDAQRAIERGGFDQDPAELVVTEGSGDDQSREAVRKHAVPQAPQGPNPAMGFGPHEVPQTPATKGPADPGIAPLPRAVPDGVIPTKTTKPAQTPGGTSPMDGSSLPTDPNSEQFGGVEPSSSKPASTLNNAAMLNIASVLRHTARLVREDNPGIDEDAVARIVAKVAGFADVPFLEDPLAEQNPLKLSEDVIKNIIKLKDAPRQIKDMFRGRGDRARWEVQRRLPHRFQEGEEESGQRTMFPEPPRRPAPPPDDHEPEEHDPRQPGRGQRPLFRDPPQRSRPYDTPPLEPEPRRPRRMPARDLFPEDEAPEPPDLGRFDRPPLPWSAPPPRPFPMPQPSPFPEPPDPTPPPRETRQTSLFDETGDRRLIRRNQGPAQPQPAPEGPGEGQQSLFDPARLT